MTKSQSGDAAVQALDNAYEAGYAAAKSPNTKVNPYGYRMQAALYWEFERGYREALFGANA